MPKRMQHALVAWVLASMSLMAAAQQLATGNSGPTSSATNWQKDSLPIAPGDDIDVHVLNVAALDQLHLRVTDTGEVPLLLLGSIQISGLTPAAAAQKIAYAYTAHHFLRDPQIQVTVEEYASSAVTVLGYVVGQPVSSQTNGLTIPLLTPKPLLTVLSLAGGFNDRASRTVTIQRRDRSVKPFSVYVPNDPSLALANNPLIYPGDIVMVPRAGIVYVLGNVGRPAGVYMSEDGKLSLMEALSQTGSPLPTAALRNVMVFRRSSGQYTQLHINLGKITKGTEPDIALQPEDVIWVPFSYGKNVLINGAAIVAAVSSATATGIVYTR